MVPLPLFSANAHAMQVYLLEGQPYPRLSNVKAHLGDARRANGSIRFEFAWPSNAGLQRFLFPFVWVRAGHMSCWLYYGSVHLQ